MILDLQEKFDGAVHERNTATQHFNAAMEELATARKERDVAVTERDQSRERCKQLESRCKELEEQLQMARATPSSSPMLARQPTLQRAPTLADFAGPMTPARMFSRNVLPTPPTTEARPRRALGRNPSELSYLGQPEDVTMQESEPTQAPHARVDSQDPQTPTPLMTSLLSDGPSSAVVSLDSVRRVLDGAQQMLQTYETQQCERDRARDTTEQTLQQQLAEYNRKTQSLQEKVAESERREHDLQRQISEALTVNEKLARNLSAMERQIEQYKTEIQDIQQRMQDTERQRVEQSLQCHEARAEVASLHIRMTNLGGQLIALTQRHAEMATLANTRIRELTAAGVEGFETILGLHNLYHWFGQQAGALMGHIIVSIVHCRTCSACTCNGLLRVAPAVVCHNMLLMCSSLRYTYRMRVINT
ncbi:hypothetical protein BV20DRAFT_417522 [Pilatotrama ljubarskyi]|nr:hypothetical protein BV20DRAFT_417522 [Pilatotrama ljubarskyi]